MPTCRAQVGTAAARSCWLLLGLLLGWSPASHALSSFQGYVRDHQTGMAIAGAQVSLFAVQSPFSGETIATDITDEHGYFYVANDDSVAFAHLSLSAAHPDYQSDGTYVSTAPGGHVQDLPLWRDGPSRATVQLRDAVTLEPITGTEVMFWFRNGTPAGGETDAQGRFVAEAFSQFGEHTVCAIDADDDYLDQCFDGLAVPPASPDTATLFLIAAGADLQLDMQLQPAASVRGRIVDRTTGIPLQGTMSFDLVDDAGGAHHRGATLDADGRYHLRGLAAGTYYIKAGSGQHGFPFYGARLWPDVPCDAGCDMADGVPVAVGVDGSSGVDFALGSVASLGGVVTDAASGAALSGVVVHVTAAGLYGGIPMTTAVTALDGSWVAAYLPLRSSVHVFTDNAMGYGNLAWPNLPCTQADCGSNPNDSFVVQPGHDGAIHFALSRGSAISGRVYVASGETGLPARLTVGRSASGTPDYRADVRGAWTTPALEPGTYFVQVRYQRWGEDLCQIWSGLDCGTPPAPDLTSGTPIVIDASGDAPGVDIGLLPTTILRAGFDAAVE